MEIDNRKENILKTLIENYIATSEPISSKALLTQMNLNVSSATVRNELQALEEKGYIKHIHTSSGRVPTEKGYRYYIDNSLCEYKLDVNTENYIQAKIYRARTPEGILKTASEILSNLTDMAAIATTPVSKESRVHKIRFVSTGRHSVMNVLITSNGVVKSKIFTTEFVVTPELLALYDKVVNENFVGVKLDDIDDVFIQSIASKLGEIALYTPEVLLSVYECIKEAKISSTFISGQTNLLFLNGYDLLSARNVLRFLSNGEKISQFLEKQNGLKVYIGNESNISELKDSSLILSRYLIANEKAGVIALVGPLKVDYKRLLAIIEFTSECISNAIFELLDLERR